MQVEVDFLQNDELKMQNYFFVNSVMITTLHNSRGIGFLLTKLGSDS